MTHLLSRSADGEIAPPLLTVSSSHIRGLDLPGISHVITLDQNDPVEYVHAAGRCGRVQHSSKHGSGVSLLMYPENSVHASRTPKHVGVPFTVCSFSIKPHTLVSRIEADNPARKRQSASIERKPRPPTATIESVEMAGQSPHKPSLDDIFK